MTRVIFGKFLELVGLTVVGGGLVLALANQASMLYELTALLAGAAIFYIGFLLERKYRS
jgi:hypothetical protein